MTMPQAGRGQAIYNAVAAQNPKVASAMSAAERSQMLNQLTAIFGADLSYVVGNATVLPTSMQSPSGQAVQVAYPAGSGSTIAPSAIVGTGNLS